MLTVIVEVYDFKLAIGIVGVSVVNVGIGIVEVVGVAVVIVAAVIVMKVAVENADVWCRMVTRYSGIPVQKSKEAGGDS